MHLALSDQLGKDGPKHPDCLTLAHLQSIAVDFAKHGECVDPSAMKRLQGLVDEWPDYFENPNKMLRTSDGILGQLFREISNEKAMEGLLKYDFEMAIKMEYELDPRILAQVKDSNRMHSYLKEVYH